MPSRGPGAGPDTLTVVVPTCHGWPVVWPCLERLRDQAQATATEVIVADGSAAPAPPAGALWPGLVCLRQPGGRVPPARLPAWARWATLDASDSGPAPPRERQHAHD